MENIIYSITTVLIGNEIVYENGLFREKCLF